MHVGAAAAALESTFVVTGKPCVILVMSAHDEIYTRLPLITKLFSVAAAAYC
jgi:hypothetical protein